ncbi:MAG: hypothetical protein LBS54_05675 [Dysgonamonadaceae bacterium]|jgi:hypothetical protein|nr:hypothetical protein [Dysgonamonadaceae bacterium]
MIIYCSIKRMPDTEKYLKTSGIVSSKSGQDLDMSNIMQESFGIFPKGSIAGTFSKRFDSFYEVSIN